MSQALEIKKLGDICDIKTGSSNTVDAIENGEYAFFDRSKKIKHSSKYLFDCEALIIPGEGSQFFPQYYNGKFDLHQRVYALFNFNKFVDIQFVKYFLIYNHKHFEEVAVGATVKSLRLRHFTEIDISLPPLSEQQRIVEILDEAFAVIAKAKANAEQNLKNANELFESYLQGVFENKGEGWGEMMLKEIGMAQTGTTPKTADKENYGDIIPFIKPADIDIKGNGEIRYDNDGLSEQGLKNGRKMLKGSILMVCIGASIGKVGFADRAVSCNQQINSLTVRKEFSPKFIYYALSTKGFFEQVIFNSAQATLPIINKGKWETLTVSFPKSKIEQADIAKKFDLLQIETKKLEAVYNQKIDNLEVLKISVLQKAFIGELKATNVELLV